MRGPHGQTTLPADVWQPVPYRVRKVRRELHDVHTLWLEPAQGAAAATAAPGQFNMLYAFGVGEVPISISGDTADSGVIVHTIRAVGAVSAALCGLKRGAVVGLRGPFGRGWPVAEARGHDVVVVAGGIGLAPLRPLIYALLAERERYGRIVILYGTRTPADMLFRKELEQWRGRFDLFVEATVDHAERGWLGPVGVVTRLIHRARFDPDHTMAMVCGPEVMIRFSVQELEKELVSPENIYISMERNMKCAVAFCGHCQYGPHFICKDGPVFPFSDVAPLFKLREV